MIREAVREDMEEVYRLICELEQTQVDREGFTQVYLQQMGDARYTIFLYIEESKVLGMLNLRIEGQLHHAGAVAEIIELSVYDGYRSKGIGRQLFEAACVKAREWDCVQMEVTSNQLRIRAHQFYERQGMKNFHYKLSMRLDGTTAAVNEIGRA